MRPVGEALDELARWTGEPLAELRHWEDLGLLSDDPGTPLSHRLERVRLVRFAIGRGYPPERLAELASSHGDMIGRFAEQIGSMVGDPVCTLDEAAEQAGMGPEVFGRLLAASGLGDQPFATEADLGAARLIKTALDYALPPAVLTQMLRVFSDSTAKIADAGSRLFHLYVHEQMRAGGTGGEELLAMTNAMAEPLLALVEPSVLYYHQKAWQQAFREDMMLHLAEEATTPSSVPGEFTRAILFADLSSFTPLTEVMGDAAAAEVVGRFSDIVRSAAAQCSGQVVKQIGDEFMLVFPDGRAAVSCGLEIAEKASSEPRFPALRIGSNVGSVLYREGDYVGTSVNLAARVTAAAQRNQFLVTEAVRRQLGALEVDVVALGTRSLKGLGEEVELFEIRRIGVRGTKAVDPVCGMELDAAGIEATLAWHGEQIAFCSTPCIERFVGDPARYRSPEGR